MNIFFSYLLVYYAQVRCGGLSILPPVVSITGVGKYYPDVSFIMSDSDSYKP